MPAEQENLFRPRKKQKVFRRRTVEDADAESSSANFIAPNTPSAEPSISVATSAEPEDDTTGTAVADIVRRRKLAHKSRGGVEFSSASTRPTPPTATIEVDTIAPRGAGKSASAAVDAVKRFAPQTGLVPDTLDKHMMAYVESKMAELREGEKRAAEDYASSLNGSRPPGIDDAHLPSAARAEAYRERQPAGMGKLQEIDLGEEVTRMNAQRTQEATRKLQSGETAEPSGERFAGRGRRGRKRRTSEDIRRDKMVEDILKESMLDNIYDRTELQAAETNDDQAADDRIVEQFRRDFMEAVQTRNKRNPPAPTGKGGKAEERPKGPKLGGSRSARAAMRAMEEQKAKKK